MSIVRAGGNTYFHKDNLKQMGFRWNLIEKRWEVESQFVTAQIKEYFLANNLEFIGFVETPSIDVSWPVGLTPYPYQVEGARFALERNASLIADEMGLGKTIQFLLVLRQCKGKALIVCPASLKINWLRELRKWAPEQEAQTTIVSWSSLGKLTNEFYDLVCADEAHACKNSKTLRFKNFRKVCARSKRKVFLTGTPVMAKPEDIFNLLQIASHPLGKSEWAFRFRYCGFFENEYGKLERGEPQHLDELKENLKGFMIRRLKKDVLSFLPSKTRELRDIEVQDEHLEVLISAENYAAKKRKVSEKKRRLFEQHAIDIDDMSSIMSELAKLKAPHAVERIEEMMEEIDSLVVFWCHKDPLYFCMKELAQFNPVFVNGDISLKERQANVDKFQSGESKIIFLTYAAGAEGITLTRASNMLMCELDWTPSKMLQAEDRTNRIGQKNAVRIEYLTFEKSLDHKILTVVMNKTDIISQIIDGENLSSLVDFD